MYAINGLIVLAMLLILFLPITDTKTVRMKLCVFCALAVVLTVSVATIHEPQAKIASLVR